MSQPHPRARIVGVNVPPGERVATAFLGGIALTAGLRRRTVGGWLLAGLGALAVTRAITGRCPLYRVRAVRRGVHVHRAVTIQATPNELYELWRDLENLPRFLAHVREIRVDERGISTWVVRQGRRELRWRAEIVEDSPGQRLRWRSLPGGDIHHEGSIELRPAPTDRGTVVDVKLHYMPPGGVLVAGALNGFLRRLTQIQLSIELARLQQLVETGEIAVSARRPGDLGRERKAAEAAQLRPAARAAITGVSSYAGEPR